MLPPLIDMEVVKKFRDVKRVKQHLDRARREDSDRYKDAADNYGQGPIQMLLTYMNDGLNQQEHDPLRRIKKRNKKFMVSISNDFDDLLVSLGFESKMVENEDSWVFPSLGKPLARTPIGTLRAKWEDVVAELMILSGHCGSTDLPQSWETLLDLFPGGYEAPQVRAVIDEADLELLGCLPDYRPKVFVWAAIVLATLPKNQSCRQLFVDAAKRCHLERDVDAQIELVQFESGCEMDAEAVDAFGAFDAFPGDGKDADYFLTKYYAIGQVQRTDEARARLYQHLEIIGGNLGEDIVSRIDNRVLDDMGATAQTTNGGMTIEQAASTLNIELNWSLELIRDVVNHLAQTLYTDDDRQKVAKALGVLAEWKRHDRTNAEAQQAVDELQGMVGIFNALKPGQEIPPALLQKDVAQDDAASLKTPPGLRNIGNTCYLNSILQYFYHVKAIRDLVLNYDQYKLELNAESVHSRKTGGNATSVDLEEAIVARQFVETLQVLFKDLQTTSEAAAQPSQKLANTALRKTARLLYEDPQSKPPPLPARPSPAPPTKGDDTDMINVTIESVSDNLETASAVSSQTLVTDLEGASTGSLVEINHVDTKEGKEEAVDNDIEMKDGHMVEFDAATIEDKIRDISERLERSDRSGTEQQDVEETMENIMEHLMRAIRADGGVADNPRMQSDRITQTFNPTIVNCTVKLVDGTPTVNKEVNSERWITAFPHPTEGETTTIYEALDRNFDVEYMDETLIRHTVIRSLPPILHVCIQRTGTSKNRNPVLIEDELYMDRYMETLDGHPESVDKFDLVRKRREIWALKERVNQLGYTVKEDAKHEVKALEPDVQHVSWSTGQSGWGGDARSCSPSDSEWEKLDAIVPGPKVPPSNPASSFTSLKRRLPQERTLANYIQYLSHKRQMAIGTTSSTSQPLFAPPPSLSSPAKSTVHTNPYIPLLSKLTTDMTKLDEEELRKLDGMKQDAFQDMRKEKYRLHAVICHGGGTQSGHYWIWLHDFQKNVWLKFNDSNVTEDTRGSEAVLQELSNGGDPYYLAYVRDDDKDRLVDVPERAAVETRAAGADEMDLEMETIEGVVPEKSGDLPSDLPDPKSPSQTWQTVNGSHVADIDVSSADEEL
ncbi:uncharacterized protein BCR38DRAFT_481821 [Pseudomassariella vexata]|uniref:ubiquitinyl hydrolase 1 n=1 Tax=Pseudomassariella vexata TaxID=1141098 RepID=A0A1Y2E9U3_9PEZI|nr:uncharacterized protein BCR38DRAFT_481821 [Pseudomassariella vexata]ORY68341.1 hypothetical protein BCR38DRAFT_481821 [Pseudomassariella vexata]